MPTESSMLVPQWTFSSASKTGFLGTHKQRRNRKNEHQAGVLHKQWRFLTYPFYDYELKMSNGYGYGYETPKNTIIVSVYTYPFETVPDPAFQQELYMTRQVTRLGIRAPAPSVFVIVETAK